MLHGRHDIRDAQFMILFWDVLKLRIATGKPEKDKKRVESSPERISQSRCGHTQFKFIFSMGRLYFQSHVNK